MAGLTVEDREVAGHVAVALDAYIRKLRRDGDERQWRALFEVYLAFRATANGCHSLPSVADGGSVGDAATVIEPRVEPIILSYSQAAEVLGCSVRTVNRLVASGALPTVTVNGRKAIHRQDLVEHAESLRSSASAVVHTKVDVRVDLPASDRGARSTTTPSPAVGRDFSPLSMSTAAYYAELERGRDEWIYR